MKDTLIIWFSISIITMIFVTYYDIKRRGFKSTLKYIIYHFPQFIILNCLGPVTTFMFTTEFIQIERLKSGRR